MSSSQYPSSHHAGECEEECAEEECDPEQCGDEYQGPRTNNGCCCDTRPVLPILLSSSTVLGACCMLIFQFPRLHQLIGKPSLILFVITIILYIVGLSTMAYCTFSDPGQLKRHMMPHCQGEEVLPHRAHKTWLYQMAIRRYDHYCRWVINCIGLLNHREFIILVACLVLIGVFGASIDVVLSITTIYRRLWKDEIILCLHFIYSCLLLGLAAPILRIHIGLVSRNELANEWKRNLFYIIHSTRSGQIVPVNELTDDEYNARFDSFAYDKPRNVYDHGVVQNCWTFWCTPRWQSDQLGEF